MHNHIFSFTAESIKKNGDQELALLGEVHIRRAASKNHQRLCIGGNKRKQCVVHGFVQEDACRLCRVGESVCVFVCVRYVSVYLSGCDGPSVQQRQQTAEG